MTLQPAPTAPLREHRFPRVRGERHGAARLGSLIIALTVLLPVATILFVALSGTGEAWPHLLRYVLPQSLGTTLVLLGLVAMGTATIGVGSAWLVVGYEFPLRRLLSWLKGRLLGPTTTGVEESAVSGGSGEQASKPGTA